MLKNNISKQIQGIVLLIIVSINSSTAQTTSNLLFKSSFDYNVVVDKSVIWNHHLSGTDTVTHYTFPDDLPGDFIEHYFNYVVGDMDHYSDYANADIVNTTGYDGTPTNALYIEFIKDDTNFTSYSRVQYAMYGDGSSSDPVQRMNQGYVKYKIKTHLDHNDTVDWRLPIEWKDMDDDGFRMGFYIYDSNTSSPYWVAKGQYMINGELGEDVWQYDNYSYPVIEDDWFELEVFWYGHPDPNLGRLKVAINGQILFDVTNQTKDPNQPNKMFYFMPFKVYGTVGYSWITDFEYWDKPPLSSVLYDNSLEVEEDNKSTVPVLFPIPTNRYINLPIHDLGVKYEVVTLTGRIIKQGKTQSNRIDVSSLETGIYFINYTEGTSRIKYSMKFIKN